MTPERKVGRPPTFWRSVRSILFHSWFNVLLVCIPVSWALHFALAGGGSTDETIIFVFSFIAIIPLAKLLAFATDELSLRVGQTLAGLLNATLGNAVELIVSIIALVKCDLQVVQSSRTFKPDIIFSHSLMNSTADFTDRSMFVVVGSILSNILLVLGMCFFAGGLKFSEQGFGISPVQLNASLLTISVIAVLLPAAFHFLVNTGQTTDATEAGWILNVSHGTAIILLFVYCSYLIFQLFSHKQLYDDDSPDPSAPRTVNYAPKAPKVNGEKASLKRRIFGLGEAPIDGVVRSPSAEHQAFPDPESHQTTSPENSESHHEEEEEDEVEEPEMSVLMTIGLLVVVTVLVAVTAEFLVDSINGLVEGEHVTAVTVSVKDKLTLSLGVAVGSSIQIALFVIPFIVTLAWIMGKPLTLLFDPLESLALFFSVMVVNYTTQDGKSNWLEGVLLMALYIILALMFWYYPGTNVSQDALGLTSSSFPVFAHAGMSQQLSFKGHTVVITGAGGGLGKAYSLFYASRGANVLVSDVSQAAAQRVVDEITKGAFGGSVQVPAGGKAVANANNVVNDGAAIIKAAVDAFGGVTILINNAGILRDKNLRNMTDQEFDSVQAVHLRGAYSVTHAAWPIFRKQKFGRIINTASAAGLYGNFGQTNYSAAKMGLVAFTKTLAREGAKYNIKATAIAPIAASAMTETVMPPELLKQFKPEMVAPFVLAITHPDGPDASGKVFEVGAGYHAEIRWERSKGAVMKPDASFTPSAVKHNWSRITDFTNPDYPQRMEDLDSQGILKTALQLPPNTQATPEVRFDNKTVIITGAGQGLGRAYALMFSRLGANVVVNDVSEKGANAVVDEITQAGGKAAAAVTTAEDGDGIVKVALEKFGGVHILIANAGILRDKSFTQMSDAEWDAVLAVHLRGTFKCVRAVWPIFLKQKYGRIVTTASQVGIYGNFGQANYSTAKAAILGFTRALSFEGKKYNILANTIAPSAGTAMTSTIWPQEMVDAFKPEYIAPIVGYLVSEDNEETSGKVFEIMGGWAAQTRWQRAGGYGFAIDRALTPEDVISKWDIITKFDDRATYPTTMGEAFEQMAENFSNTSSSSSSSSPYADPEDSAVVAKAKEISHPPGTYSYGDKEVILYNLSVGATEQELQWTFENSEDFASIPTFGVIPQFETSFTLPLDWLPNYNPAKLLHGEQFLEIKAPIPLSGELVSESHIMEVLDKGKAAAVTTITQTKDKVSGKLIFENTSTVFIRGAGGFGGKRTGKDRGPATAANTPPKRQPDAVIEEKTQSTQAALYRLNADRNPLHILPEFAAIGGFDKPILHGLCTMGIAGKHVLKSFGSFKDIKVRFAGVVYPGETLVTEMWKEGDKVLFSSKVKERNATVLAAAAATLSNPSGPLKAKL
ncbi:hypothetical protein EIP91_008269 [Steccherinum ochraceum]|uniref:Ketoreductase domain-containing protein n=1 Tax=Steccherinum ochraceum TaxID=92696 RepID=A0A4R0R328_9APHY|nr:hypothetical protein EIP91_008269 [Steccherinum ochraceum]